MRGTEGVFDEMVAVLDGWRSLPPEEQIVRLWLLGMEREQIVAVAYAEARIQARLARMPIDDAVRQTVLHALRWAWRDEEMHAVYVRGVLKSQGGWLQSAQTTLARLQGGVAGWVSAVQQHHRWREAPVARAIAEVLEIGGTLAGKVPAEARAALQFKSFKDFAVFNVDAERTAELAWRRMVELAASPGVHVPEADVEAFARMAEDEARHAALFEVLYRSFDDADRLVDGLDAEALFARIAAVDPVMVPSSVSGVGFGGRVQVVQGAQVAERESAFEALISDSGLLERVRPGMHVAVKTVFMRGTHRDDPSPIVAPVLIRRLAELLVSRGARVSVLEAPNLYDRFLGGRSVDEVARYFGIDGPFTLVDAAADAVPGPYRRGTAQRTVSRAWAEADLRIAFGKLACHPVDQAALVMDALQGLGAPTEGFLFADRRADRATSMLMVLDQYPPHLALLDAWSDVADGVAGVLGSAWPATPLRFYAGEDALAVDRVVARDLGVVLSAVHPLKQALDWFGDPLPDLTIDGHDGPIEDWRGVYHTPGSSLLGLLAFPMFERGSRRGALFVPRTDSDAFPPRVPPTRLQRGMRSVVRRLLDLA
ncbi:MAG: DUF362 domain-containing protein [Myxococcota bacterium]